MVLENICIVLNDVCSESSLVKFGDSGILQAAYEGKLIADKVVLTGVLMVPGLTRNLVLEGWLDDKGSSIHTQQETKQVYNINGKFCFHGIKENGLYVWEPHILKFPCKYM